ncbi:flagellar basal body P-ring protein FlgI [Reinekea forsetii]|nr:flagellar basal body P-ring protein FlgI [Reinekea forsetii]
MKTIFLILLISLSIATHAEPLSNLASVEDGLKSTNLDNVSDDYIRLTLNVGSYQTASAIKNAVESWLGPDMVIVESVSLLKIQAPRDSTARVEFLSALLNLDIQ